MHFCAVVARLYGFCGHDTPKQTALQATLIVLTFVLLAIPLGLSLKRIALHFEGRTARGEAVVTARPTGSRRPKGPQAQPAAPARPDAPAQQHNEQTQQPQASAKLAELVFSIPGEQNFSWRALPVAEEPGRFSSESARVRARRVARETSHHRGGNHRK